jgi:hypothetical protein
LVVVETQAVTAALLGLTEPLQETRLCGLVVGAVVVLVVLVAQVLLLVAP